MPTFEEYRQKAARGIESMLADTNAMADPSLYGDEAAAQYVAKSKRALEITQRQDATPEQWKEALNLMKECNIHAMESELAAGPEADDDEQVEAIEQAGQNARELADSAAQAVATAIAWLDGFREGVQQQS